MASTRQRQACLYAAVWLTCLAPRCWAAPGVVPVELPVAPISAQPSLAVRAISAIACALKLAPALAAPAALPPSLTVKQLLAPPALAAPAPEVKLPEAVRALKAARSTVKLAERADGRPAALANLFDGASRPGFQAHESVPQAVLPDGSALGPDSFLGGFHGNTIPPERVVADGGFKARGPVEDWRLKEHSEATSKPVSAFRGSTPFPTSPDGETGASYWAGEGGWVYELAGVPTWGVNSSLEGRVQKHDLSYRGALMREIESALPARTPLECIKRWGQVRENHAGRLFVPTSAWMENPRYDAATCRQFWGASRS